MTSTSDVFSVSWQVLGISCRMSGTFLKVPATIRRTGRSGLTAHLRINALRQKEGGGRERVSDSPYVKSLALSLCYASLGFTVRLCDRDALKEMHCSALGHKVSIVSWNMHSYYQVLSQSLVIPFLTHNKHFMCWMREPY